MDALWSPKGGSGTSVLSAALARTMNGPVVLFDMGGDQPAIWGVGTPVVGWSDIGSVEGEPGDNAVAAPLDATVVEVGMNDTGCAIVPRGSCATWGDGVDQHVLDWMRRREADGDRVIVDVGTVERSDSSRTRLAGRLLAAANRRFVVIRPCYLGMRRLSDEIEQHGADGLVVVREPGRALGVRDIERAIGREVVATIDIDPSVARCIDAGLFARRPPRALIRAAASLC